MTYQQSIKFAFCAFSTVSLITGFALAANSTYVAAKTPIAKAEFNFRVTLIPVPGTIKNVDARINFDPKNLSKIQGSISVDLTKLETGIGLRDEHARNALDTVHFPKAIFNIKSLKGLIMLEPNKTYKATASGNFLLKGITKPLDAPIELSFDGKNLNVKTAFNIALADHKIAITGADANVDVKVQFTLTPEN